MRENPVLNATQQAIGSMAVPLGSALFAWQTRLPIRILLGAGLLCAGAGLTGVAWVDSYGALLASVLLNQFGCGLFLPTLLTWVVQGLPFALRGRGCGAWTASFFLGQFASPLLLLASAGALGGLLVAVSGFGAVGLLGSLAAVFWWFRRLSVI